MGVTFHRTINQLHLFPSLAGLHACLVDWRFVHECLGDHRCGVKFMCKEDEQRKDIDLIDTDLYEDIADEEMYELVQEGRREVLEKERREKEHKKSKRPFPKWAFWLISFALILNLFALLPQTLSIPVIEFLTTSAKLSGQPEIKEHKKAVVVVETPDGRGTGFAISKDGTIITNHHVIAGEDSVTVAFSDEGLFTAEVTADYPAVDLAILKVDADNLPYLKLASKTTIENNQAISFIGNPLRFQGIANKGTIIDYINLSDWDQPVVMIDAPVYHGNSGSPIFNHDGEVIGIIFATLNHNKYGKVGLFVPIDYYYEQIAEKGDR